MHLSSLGTKHNLVRRVLYYENAHITTFKRSLITSYFANTNGIWNCSIAYFRQSPAFCFALDEAISVGYISEISTKHEQNFTCLIKFIFHFGLLFQRCVVIGNLANSDLGFRILY